MPFPIKGAIADPADRRDLRPGYALIRQLPDDFHWFTMEEFIKDWAWIVRQQGREGTCTSHASIAAFQLRFKLKFGFDAPKFAVRWLYTLAQKADRSNRTGIDGLEGTWLRANMQVMHKAGLGEDKDVTYTPGDKNPILTVSNAADLTLCGWKYRIHEYRNLMTDRGLSFMLRNECTRNGPFPFATKVPPGFGKEFEIVDGYKVVVDNGETIPASGHAMTFLGWRQLGGKTHAWFLNSHGPDFGDHGTAHWELSKLTARMHAAWGGEWFPSEKSHA